MKRLTSIAALVFPVALTLGSGCSDEAGKKPNARDGGDVTAFDAGTELRVPVAATGKVFVKLSTPSVVTVAEGAEKSSLDWDLAFEGLDVFTNGGVSGGGKGAAFGPLDAVVFLEAVAPQVPFLTKDAPGGAFRDWYAYEGSSHGLYSRYHVYGVADGDRLWKVQVLAYYGQRDGAATPGLYQLRYADVKAGGETKEITLDGTAGGASAPETAESECVDLGTGATSLLSPSAARTSNAWHLCARRSSILVNGEIGGPRGITAVDLHASDTASETLDAVKTKTADGERGRFDAVDGASFGGKSFRGDRIVSALTDHWVTAEGAVAPVVAAWLVQDAAGAKYLVGFPSFENATATSPGTVVMRIKPLKG